MSKDPRRAARFGAGMSALITSQEYELSSIINTGPWSTLRGATIVDIGGSHGDVVIAVARAYPSLQFVVQDLPETIDSRPLIPGELESRITFMAHDFFTPQPVKNADLYFFRWIFHNWSDKYCLLILRYLILALKPQARILIVDFCLPEPNTTDLLAERQIRCVHFNSRWLS